MENGKKEDLITLHKIATLQRVSDKRSKRGKEDDSFGAEMAFPFRRKAVISVYRTD